MPRAEAKALFDLIKPIGDFQCSRPKGRLSLLALAIDPKLFVEIMGSYRRGKPDCGDIDIMITRDPSDGRTHAGKPLVLPSTLISHENQVFLHVF